MYLATEVELVDLEEPGAEATESLARVEAGHLDLAIADVALAELAEELLADFELSAASENVRLASHVPADTIVRADPRRLRQMLINVIGNAVSFSAGGSVRVRASDREDEIDVEVTDTGIGMSQDDVETALRPFGQVDNRAYQRRHQGTGLGLPLVDRLIRLHGGRIEIESTPGAGTTVHLLFPRSTAEETPPAARPDQALKSVAGQ